MRKISREDWLDGAAMGASIACIVHCLALPLMFAALPALAAVVSISESVHLRVLLFAVPTSDYALIAGRGRHGAVWPLHFGTTGLAFLALGAVAMGGLSQTIASVIGSLALATTHLGNWRARHRETGSSGRAQPLNAG